MDEFCDAIARITIENTEVRGTGFLVAPDLVATALHVVANRETEPPTFLSGKITLHFQGRFGTGLQDHDVTAEVVDKRWNQDADCVLLECKESVDSRPTIPLQDLSESDGLWKTHGYPDSQSIDGMVWEGKVNTRYGRLTSSYETRRVAYEPVLQLYAIHAAAGKGGLPKGLSGAPVIVGTAAVGLLRTSLLEGERAHAGTLYACSAKDIMELWPERLKLRPALAPAVSRYLDSYLDPPALPVGYVERPKELGELRSLVLRKGADAIAITAVRGMPGAGKSVLAKSLLLDPAIRDAYRDILWVTLGRAADPLTVMQHVTTALRAPWGNHVTIEAGSSQVRRLLRDRNTLIVLDDVWDSSQVLNFRADGAVPSAILFTTRKEYVVSQTGAVELRLRELTEAQALQLLANRCQRPVATLPAEAKSIIEESGNLALAVAIAGTRLRSKPAASWRLVLQQLKSADLERLGSLEDYEHKDVFRAIHVSAQDLPEAARARYSDICVFPEDVAVPLAALEVLWSAAPEDVLPTVEAWVDGGLAEFDAEGRLTFHDLLLDYARLLCGDPLPVHKRLLAAYGKLAGPSTSERGLLATNAKLSGTYRWSAVPDDGYARMYLTHHLETVGAFDDIHQLLQEKASSGQNAWYEAKESIGDIPGFIADVHRAWRLADQFQHADPQSVSLSLQVSYLLAASSVRSLIRNVPARLWIDAAAEGVITTPGMLALIHQIPGEFEQAQMLLDVISHLGETDSRETAFRVLAMAKRLSPSSQAALLLKLVSHLRRLPLDAKQKAFVATAAAGELTASKPRVEVLCVLAALADHATQRQAHLEDAYALARQLAQANADWSSLVRLVSLLPDKVPEILDTLLARPAGDRTATEELIGHLAVVLPLASDQSQKNLVRKALTVANAETNFRWARLLGPIAAYLPTEAVLARWEKVHAELKQRKEGWHVNFTAPEGVEVAHLLPADMRSQVFNDVLGAVRTMDSYDGSFGVYGKAEALARLVPLLAGDARGSLHAEALEAAARVRDPKKKSRVLHLLADFASRAARPSIVRRAWNAARSLDDFDDVIMAACAFVPLLDHALLGEVALSIENYSRGSTKTRGLHLLAVRFANDGDTRRALTLLAHFDDLLGQDRASALRDIGPRLTERDLDAALAVVAAMPQGCYKALAMWVLASRFPQKSAQLIAEGFQEPFEEKWIAHQIKIVGDLVQLGFLRDAVRLVREKVDRYDDRIRALRSIARSLQATTAAADVQWLLGQADGLLGSRGGLAVASALPAGMCDSKVVDCALEMIVRNRSPAAKASALADWLPHLPEGDRAPRVAEIFSLLDGTGEEKPRLLNLVAPYLPKALLDEALKHAATIDQQFIQWLLPIPVRLAELDSCDKALQFVREIHDPAIRARALAGLVPHVRADERAATVAECLGLLAESEDKYECAKAWSALAPVLPNVPVDALYVIWRDVGFKFAGKRRTDLLIDIAGMLPLIRILGGLETVQLAFLSLQDTTTWWSSRLPGG
jgi:hypothetical protein